MALVTTLVAGALIVAVVAGSHLNPFGGHITVTAQFDSAAGLYEGNVVAVLGMPVGKVKRSRRRASTSRPNSPSTAA